MSDDIVVKKPGILSYLSGGCGCLGLLVALAGAGTLVAIPGGAFNYSAEGSAMIAGGSSCCMGSLVLFIGIIGWYLGRKKVVI